MNRLINHLRSNVVGYVALFIALGGTSYAAVSLPAASVGSRQLRNHSVGASKLDPGSIGGYVRYWAQIGGDGRIIASRPKAHLVGWQVAPPSGTFGGLVGWMKPIPSNCFTLATTVPDPSGTFQSYASATLQGAGGRGGPFAGAFVYMSSPNTGVNIAVICPEP